ncbi:hypothetical protein JXQ70_00030 [bacterium]|nr:hypothetical protein [bacterium]
MKATMTPKLVGIALTGYLLLASQIVVLIMGPLSESICMLPFRMAQHSGSLAAATFLKRTSHHARAQVYYEKAEYSAPLRNRAFVQTQFKQNLILQAMDSYVRGNHTSALKSVRMVISDELEHSLDELLLLGMCYYHVHQYKRSAHIAARLSARYPDELSVRLYRFRIRLALQGLEAYKQCRIEACLPIETDPDSALTVADLLWNAGYYHEAGEIYQAQLDHAPSSPEYLYRSALYAYRIRDDEERARTLLEKLIKLDYRYPGARKEYTRIIQSGRWPEHRPKGHFPELGSLTMFQNTWPHLLGITLDSRRGIIEEAEP